jgi:hypothetical protein
MHTERQWREDLPADRPTHRPRAGPLSTSSVAQIHLEVLAKAAMTSAPWPPLVRWSLLAGGAQGRIYLIPSGGVVLARNAAPVAETCRLFHQPPQLEVAPPVSGRRSSQLAATRVGPRHVARPAHIVSACLRTARARGSPRPAGCRSCRTALLRSPEARAHLAVNAVAFLEARVVGAAERAPTTRADRRPPSMPLTAWISDG